MMNARQPLIFIQHVRVESQPELSHVTRAENLACLIPRTPKGREQDRGEDCYDRYNNKKLYQGECPAAFHQSSFPSARCLGASGRLPSAGALCILRIDAPGVKRKQDEAGVLPTRGPCKPPAHLL